MGGVLTCYEIWGLFVWNQCHFPDAANQSLLLETYSALDLHHLLSSFLPFLLLPWLLLLNCFSGRLSSHQSCPEMVDSARDSLSTPSPPTECSPRLLAHSQGCSHHSPAIPKSTSLTSWACEISSCGLGMAKPRTCPSPVLLDHHQFCSRSDLVSDQGLPVLSSKYSSDSS